MLFSATLSQNPEKLQQLNLFQPKLFTSVVKKTNLPKLSLPHEDVGKEIDSKGNSGDLSKDGKNLLDTL